jgi:pimeloyl-ACP methyl ester carboxylesterase
MGVSEGGSLAVLFAASHPERCSALILYGVFARFSDWFPTKQKFDGFLNYVETAWGTGKSIAAFAPSKKGDAEFQRWWGRFERLGGSPSAVINLMRTFAFDVPVISVLPRPAACLASYLAVAPPTLIPRKDSVAQERDKARRTTRRVGEQLERLMERSWED